jgi:glycosyltransferase involved in cell wall biosynthesis
VTPSFQQGHFLERTIRSVLDQGYPNLEYHVQDGASTDGTREVLKRYARQLSGWRRSRTAGQTQAINARLRARHRRDHGVAQLRRHPLPGALAYVADFFVTDPEVDVVYGHRLLIDEERPRDRPVAAPATHDYVLSWADYMPQETLFWRRRLWDKVGGGASTRRSASRWIGTCWLRFRDARARFVRVPRHSSALPRSTRSRRRRPPFQRDRLRRDGSASRERALGRVPSQQRDPQGGGCPTLMRHSAVDKFGWRIVTHWAMRA